MADQEHLEQSQTLFITESHAANTRTLNPKTSSVQGQKLSIEVHAQSSDLDHSASLWEKRLNRLPQKNEPWPKPQHLIIGPENDQDDIPASEVKAYLEGKLWVWPSQTAYFFCDQHADADAFMLSLVASGGVAKTGDADSDIQLTPDGRQAVFIIGGDCFDKGPDNLRLLDLIKTLKDLGAQVKILCGNHDLRTYLGIHYCDRKEPQLDHLFVRMGKKTVPLLKEIYDRYLSEAPLPDMESVEELKAKMYPNDSWFEQFPRVATPLIPKVKIDKELVRIREKKKEFEERCDSFGLSPQMTFAAVLKFKELFFEADGLYHWFFNDMELAYRHGSYLFVHAGVDDSISKFLLEHSLEELNQSFHRTLKEDPFTLYHGRLGNVFRTKYRDFDFPLTSIGTQALKDAGIHAIVHGHRNILHGHRLVIRQGILNFECDTSVDRNTRKLEGLYGPGASVVIFQPNGQVQGISTDYPAIKTFTPSLVTLT
jgi:hypothetical protein